ncbi:TIR domain-containing protein [Citrobacter sp. Cm046]|uniref:TIR domain-containing protein n=1 Tax=Citrobacter sp. Cm046 TaxID=2985118 RepID=UPI0025775A1B|nr:TIR domain-containing protein [Citrobacter sp. Cm046]MDM2928487.1 TIR domain-containing protein [Citrobacter sp. Cm046]
MNDKIRVFISYSHDDKEHKENILKYLKPNQNMEIWYDKELMAGDVFDDVISSKIEESDVFIFLITQDFLTSKYCIDIEVSKALERKSLDDGLRIIPVVLDYCTFKKSNLSKFNALPNDAKPVKSYQNINQAYLEISEGIEEVINYLLEKKKSLVLASTDMIEDDGRTLNPTFKTYLAELGFTIQHRRKECLFLNDLFIYPDLKRTKYDFDDYDVFVNSKNALNETKVTDNKILLIGSEQSGKTTLAKILFKTYHDAGLMPVLIKGDAFKKIAEIDSVINGSLNEQYLSVDKVISDELIVIIDDITESPMNEKFQRGLLKKITKDYKNILIIADSKIRFSDQLLKDFEQFTVYEIAEFSHLQKSELVEKWNQIGIDETCFVEDIQNQNDNLKRNIDSILMKNIVPSKPIFILMILQILESNTQSNFSLTSYGHCYHSLIIQAFNKANVKADELNDYFNYLGELSYFIYQKGNHAINYSELEEFKTYYSNNYYIVSHDEILEKLKRSKIIHMWAETVKFQYKYIYYFFTAKKITELSSEDALSIIETLCDRIHTEKNANILIFITHHTKDTKIIECITSRLSNIFKEYEKATLGKADVDFLNEMAGEIPQIVLETRDVEKERVKALEQQDKKERLYDADIGDEEEDVSAINNDLLDVNRSYKAVEVLGQIIRNRKGSIPIPQLEKLGMETYSIGFRFLGFYYSITRELKDEIISEVHRLISEKKNWSMDKIAKEASLFYWTYSYIMSLNVIKKIAYSVGHKDLTSYYSKLSEKFGTEISKLVEITIQLEFTKKINRNDIGDIWLLVKDNLMTRRLLQEIMITHLHMHYTNHEDKAWIAEKLNIPIKDQLAMQQRNALKTPQIKIEQK